MKELTLHFLTNKDCLAAAGYILSSLLVTSFYLLFCEGAEWSKNQKRFLLGIPLLICALCLLRQKSMDETWRLMAFCIFLTKASIEDIRTRQAADENALGILLLSPASIQSFLSVLLVLLIAGLLGSIIQEKNLGGADYKLTIACSAYLGFQWTIYALCIGLVLGICYDIRQKSSLQKNEICYIKENEDQGFALIPFLSFAFLLISLL